MSSTHQFHFVKLPVGRFVVVETIFNEGAEPRFQKTHLAVYSHRETGFKGGGSIVASDGETYETMHDPVFYTNVGNALDIAMIERNSGIARRRSYQVATAILNATFPNTIHLPQHLDKSYWIDMVREQVLPLLHNRGLSNF